MSKKTVLSYAELPIPPDYFANRLSWIEHGKTEAIRAAVRKALARWKPSDRDIDCLALLVVFLDPPHYRHLDAAAIADIREEIKLLKALCSHYEKRVPELRERWCDESWNAGEEIDPVPLSRHLIPRTGDHYAVEEHQALMAIMAYRRRDLLEHSLSLDGEVQTHDAYEIRLESLARQYYCDVPPRVDGRGKATPLFPEDVVFHVMYRTLAECGVRGAARRYAIIAKLTTAFARRKTIGSVKALINRVKAQRIPNP